MTPVIAQDDQVLNLTEAAHFIRVSQKTLSHMARNRRVPCQRVGREWRFLRRHLEAWLAGSTLPSAVAEPTVPYRQVALFPESETADTSERKASFADTAFTKNRREPLHRWVPWIAGFSASFVTQVLDLSCSGNPQEITILDPFAGVGTTLVEGLKRGYNVVGFEINPYAILACDIKLSCGWRRVKPLSDSIRTLEALWQRGRFTERQPLAEPPHNFRTKTAFFSPAVEHQVLLVQDFIAEQSSSFVRQVLKLALGSVMVSFSNYSYEPSLSTRFAAGKNNIEHADVLRTLCDKLWEIEADIVFFQQHLKRFAHKPPGKIHPSSYLENSDLVPALSVDALVTSPPYLNNYHYVRNTRPQLYWLGLVEENVDLKRLEEDNFGQFWQTVRGAPPVELAFGMPELESILQSIRNRNTEKGTYGGRGWANYAATYFNDCYRFFQATRRVMKPGAWVVIVIGNNIVQGVHIETDRFLAEIAKLHGFTLEGMHRVRKKRTGSSIVNSSVRAGQTTKRVDLYETAVELRAPK